MKFEVPYNFDEKLIKYYQKNTSHINYLYLPAYKDDSPNTRSSIQTKTKGHCYMPQSRAEYEDHLAKIVKAGLRFVILWQVRGLQLTSELIKYYSSVGTSGFIVADDENATKVKQLNHSLLVICSLVQRVNNSSVLFQKNLSLYDSIILYYPFNRSLDALRKIEHLKDKIVLMPNTFCTVDCPSVHHWFPKNKQKFRQTTDCPVSVATMRKSGFIFPEHLHLFDKYVSGYKLQGREYPTEAIKHLCHFYFTREEYSDFVDPFLGEELSEALKMEISKMPIEEYYNSQSEMCLK